MSDPKKNPDPPVDPPKDPNADPSQDPKPTDPSTDPSGSANSASSIKGNIQQIWKLKTQEELKGLELNGDLKCDLENHEQQKILLINIAPNCLAKRRLACGYCNEMHTEQVKSLIKLTNFREKTMDNRLKLNNTLSKYSELTKQKLLNDTLIKLIEEKQDILLKQFKKTLENQKEQLTQLIDATTENHRFEQRETVSRVGTFFQKVEDIFAMKWEDLREENFGHLIRLHEKLPQYEEPLLQLDQKRDLISQDLNDMIADHFIENEQLLSQFDQDTSVNLKKILEKTYQEKLEQNLNESRYQHSNIHGWDNSIVDKSVINSSRANSVVMDHNQSNQFASQLFKEDHAPQLGWRELDKLPLWTQGLPYHHKILVKNGPFKNHYVFPDGMDFIKLSPLESVKGDVYHGQWRNGQRWGKGICFYKNGQIYEGNWQKDKHHYTGRIITTDGSYYQGDFKENQQCGKGIFAHFNGCTIEGQFQNDLAHGRGVEVYLNGDIFEGEFKDGKKEGKGRLRAHDGSEIIGVWKEGKLVGKGEWRGTDGRIYIGEFKDDKKEGQGLMQWVDGRSYEGPWKAGMMQGIGVFKQADGTVQQGEWVNGQRLHWIEDKKSDSKLDANQSVVNQPTNHSSIIEKSLPPGVKK